MYKFIKYQKLTLGWALFVLVMCNMHMGGLTHSPRFFPGFDKLVHCGFFFVFTVLAAHGIIKQKGKLSFAGSVKVLALAIVFGALIEVLQLYLFTWRSGEWNDLFADTVGAGMATFSNLMIVTAINDEKN